MNKDLHARPGPGKRSASVTGEDAAAGEVGSEQLSRVLMITPTRIGQLVAQGWLTKNGRARYPLVACIQGYIKFLKDEERRGSASAAATGASNARTEKMQLEMAIRRRDLIPLADAESVLVEFAGHVRAGIAGIPAAATRDPAARAAVMKACDDTLRSLAGRAAEASVALAPDRGDAPALGADSAG